MAREELSINVTAKDDASKVLGQVAKTVDKLEGEKVEVKVGADTDAAERDIAGLLSKVDKLGGGEAANLLLATNASQITTEIADLVIKLDTLDANDPAVDITVANIAQLQGDLDAVAAKAKEINDTPIKLDTSGATQGIDDIGRSADSSKSVLANMVGNSAQDMSALGGAAGSAGVAIGQMGEYMADAASSGEKFGSIARNFATVAGPIAAITLTMQAVKDVMQRFEESSQRTKDSVDDIAGAMRDGSSAAEAYGQHIEEVGQVTLDNVAAQSKLKNVADELTTKWYVNPAMAAYQSFFGDVADEAENMVPSLVKAKITSEEWTKFVADGTTGAAALKAELAGTTLTAEEQARVMTTLGQAQEHVGTASLTAGQAQEFFGDSTEASNAALDLAIQKMTTAPIDSATQSYIAQGTAIEENAQRVEDLAESYGEASAGLAQAIDDADAFATALGRLNQTKDLDFSQMALNTVDSFDAMKEAIKGTKDVAVDWSTVDLTPDSVDELKGIPDELAAVTAGISGMRDTIQTELTAAFETGGIDAYTEKAEFFRTQVLDQFPAAFQEMGASEEEATAQAQALADELGLLPEDVTIMIQLTREEEARAAIEQFSGFIDDLPLEKQVAIRTAVSQGDINAALLLLNEQLIEYGFPPIVLPVDADIAAAETAISGVVTLADGSTGTVQIDGNPDPATGAVNGVVTFADGSTGTVTVDGNADPGKGEVTAVVTFADGSTGTVQIAADDSQAQDTLAKLTKTRTMSIIANIVPARAPGAGGGPVPQVAMVGPAAMVAAAPIATAVAAPAALPPIYINIPAPQSTPITINAGVIGNRFDVDRTVTKAFRRFQRFNGQRP